MKTTISLLATILIGISLLQTSCSKDAGTYEIYPITSENPDEVQFYLNGTLDGNEIKFKQENKKYVTWPASSYICDGPDCQHSIQSGFIHSNDVLSLANNEDPSNPFITISFTRFYSDTINPVDSTNFYGILKRGPFGFVDSSELYQRGVYIFFYDGKGEVWTNYFADAYQGGSWFLLSDVQDYEDSYYGDIKLIIGSFKCILYNEDGDSMVLEDVDFQLNI